MSDRAKLLQRPINVLHVIAHMSVGGMEQRLKEMVIRYSKDRFHPVVCCLRDEDVVGWEIEQHGIEVIRLNRMQGKRFDPIIIWMLYRLMKKRGFSVIETHGYQASLYGRLAAWWAGVPVIISSSHNVYQRKAPRRFWINRLLAGCSDRIIAISERVKEDLVRLERISPEKIEVISNGVDPVLFENRMTKEEAREKLSLPRSAFVIGTVGRLSVAKGHRYLLDAFRLVLDEENRLDLRLVLIGDGSLRRELERTVSDLGLEKRVSFLGTRRDVPDCLRAFDLFVFPSLWEGQGVALIEAMAAGIPIIATDYEGVREILTDGVEALIVKPRDPEALKKGILRLLQNRGLQTALAEAAARRARTEFSMERLIRKHEELYLELLDIKGFR